MSFDKRFDLSQRNLYLCTPIRNDFDTFLPQVLKGGVDVLQLRDKSADAKSLIHAGLEAKKIAHDFDVPFFINDRPDIALEIGADGVHVGQDDVSPTLVKQIMPSALIGLSTHCAEELTDSLGQEVDYISAGPMNKTPTKPGRQGTGQGYLELAASVSTRPVFVTGGVEPSIIGTLVGGGIRHFVVVRYITEATDPFRNASELRRAINTALG